MIYRSNMMCYEDKTFCKAKDCKHFNGCSLAYTEQVIKDAEIWWGATGAPIAVTDKRECYEPLPKK